MNKAVNPIMIKAVNPIIKIVARSGPQILPNLFSLLALLMSFMVSACSSSEPFA